MFKIQKKKKLAKLDNIATLSVNTKEIKTVV